MNKFAIILSTLLVASCTMSMSIFKNNNGSSQSTQQSVKNDSVNLSPTLKLK